MRGIACSSGHMTYLQASDWDELSFGGDGNAEQEGEERDFCKMVKNCQELATSLTGGLENNGVMGRIVAGTLPRPGGQLSMCLSPESLLLTDKGFRNVEALLPS